MTSKSMVEKNEAVAALTQSDKKKADIVRRIVERDALEKAGMVYVPMVQERRVRVCQEYLRQFTDAKLRGRVGVRFNSVPFKGQKVNKAGKEAIKQVLPGAKFTGPYGEVLVFDGPWLDDQEPQSYTLN